MASLTDGGGVDQDADNPDNWTLDSGGAAGQVPTFADDVTINGQFVSGSIQCNSGVLNGFMDNVDVAANTFHIASGGEYDFGTTGAISADVLTVDGIFEGAFSGTSLNANAGANLPGIRSVVGDFSLVPNVPFFFAAGATLTGRISLDGGTTWYSTGAGASHIVVSNGSGKFGN